MCWMNSWQMYAVIGFNVLRVLPYIERQGIIHFVIDEPRKLNYMP